MENIIVKWSSGEYEVDSDRTIEKYRQLLTGFLESELFLISPFATANDELDAILDRRTNNDSGFSWIESANMFYSRCRLEQIVHCNDRYPWDQLSFQPWQNFPIVSMNRFTREGAVLLENERITLPLFKKYEVLGSQGDTTQLRYFQQKVGESFVFCYKFDILDEYNKNRFCLRFAEDAYKREALLLTQFFSIQYLINHPYECFPVPYLCGSQGGIQDLNAMATLLNPVIEEKKATMIRLLDRFHESIVSHNLRAETI